MGRTLALIAAAVCGLSAIGLPYASAQGVDSFTLTDNGWTYSETNLRNKPLIDVRNGNVGGLANWTFNGGSDHFDQNWWWYRSLNDSREYGLSNETQFVQNPAAIDQAELVYFESLADGTIGALQTRLRYDLDGIDANNAKLTINWNIRNLSPTLSTPLDLFAYADPNFGTQSVGTLNFFNPLVGKLHIDDLLAPRSLLLTAGTSNLAGWEIQPVPVTLGKLSDGNIDNLSNSITPLGPTNAAAAYQWHFELSPLELVSGVLTKEITLGNPEPLIPEAGSLALALPALASLAALRRRQA